MVCSVRWMRLVASCALLAVWFAPAPRAYAEIIVNEKVQYYPVEGRSGVELAKAMVVGAVGPINRQHAIAATSAAYRVGDAQIAVRNGRCVVDDIAVVLDLTYHLPRWRNRSSARPAVRRAWDVFYEELVRHEQQHGRIAREGARELERTLKSLSGNTLFNCNDFGAFSSVRLNLLSWRIRQRQLAFDRREHSVTSRISRLQAALIDAE